MSQHQRTARAFPFLQVAWCALLCVLGGAPVGAYAARAPLKSVAQADLMAHFGALAQNRPRPCSGEDAPLARIPGWQPAGTECAWQNRLRIRRWTLAPGVAQGCVSPQAQWWAALPRDAARPPAWRVEWHARSAGDVIGALQRIAIIRQSAGGEWAATEWFWNPSPRAATRRWQQGRWDLLAALASALNQPVSGRAASSPVAKMVQSTWENNLGARAGEIDGASWRWQAGGVCLHSEPVEPGPQQLHIPYSVQDSRLEQRSAMQLQLARRYPKATWLTPFRLIPGLPHGGAKFDAIWIEDRQVNGQLWIPTKGDGPVLRLRISTSLPGAPNHQPPAALVARAAQTVEREIGALAIRWAVEHE